MTAGYGAHQNGGFRIKGGEFFKFLKTSFALFYKRVAIKQITGRIAAQKEFRQDDQIGTGLTDFRKAGA